VPVFGDSRFLEACLESIRQPEYRDYEVIVAGDGLPEPARIAAACRGKGGRRVRLARNRGPGPARNAAAPLAAGEILVSIGSGETVPAQTLGRIATLLEAEPSLDAVAGSVKPAPGCEGQVAL
jgi:CRISPR system Cascade subunit CasB